MRSWVRSLEELRRTGVITSEVMDLITSQGIDIDNYPRTGGETVKPWPLWARASPIAYESESIMPDRHRPRNECHTLLVELRRYDDGCVILSGTLSDRYQRVDLHEKYPTRTPAGRILRTLAAFVTGWEKGTLDQSDLWDQLQLPLDSGHWK